MLIAKQIHRQLSRLLVLTIPSFVAQNSFGQTPDVSPDITISVGGQARSQLCVGEVATFSAENTCTAEPLGGPSAISYVWSGAVTGTGQSVPGTFLTTGNKTASVSVSYPTTEGGVYSGSADEQFTVKGVTSINHAQSAVCLESPEAYQVTTSPPNCYEGVTISTPHGEVVSFNTGTGVAIVKLTLLSSSDNDKKTVTAKCGAVTCSTCTSEASTQVIVTEAASVTRVPASAPSEVCKGDSQEFQVETTPPGHYEHVQVDCAQSSQVTYNSATGRATVLFDQGADNAVLTATCGPNPVSISTPVVDIVVNQCTNVGVSEILSLNAQVTPANREVKWTVDGEATEFTGNPFSYPVGDQNRNLTIVVCDTALTDCCFELPLQVVGQCDPDSPDPSSPPGSLQVEGDCECDQLSDHGCVGIPTGPGWIVEYSVCYRNDSWFVEVYGDAVVHYCKKFCQGTRTDINTAYDQAVDESTYCCILQDLQPGANSLPPCARYISANCTNLGLQKLKDEFLEILEEEWNTADPAAEQLNVGFVCGTRDTEELAMDFLEPQIQQIFDTAFNNSVNDWENAPLDEAIAVANTCYEGIIGPLQSRADAENWAPCTDPTPCN